MMIPSTRYRKQPLDYRQEEVSRIMQRWNAGESCSLVGVGSVGLSNLLQHLTNPDILAEYTRKTSDQNLTTIMIDPSMLGPVSLDSDRSDQMGCWAGCELVMHRLYLAFYQSDLLTSEEQGRFADTYQQLSGSPDSVYGNLALRYLELIVDMLVKKDIRLVFMFNKFEMMLRKLPVSFFASLRGLRDRYKKQILYLTATNLPLPLVVEEQHITPTEIRGFVDLFTDNTFFVGPYNDRDAHRMVDALCARNLKEYDEHMKAFLVWATGGFAGSLRAAFRMLEHLPDLDLTSIMTNSPDLARTLSRMPSVRAECITMWQSLSDPERDVLLIAAGLLSNDHIPREGTESLVKKKLLSNSGSNGISINPPVFYYFVLNDELASPRFETEAPVAAQVSPGSLPLANALSEPSMEQGRQHAAHVFISYSRKDVDMMERIKSGLVKASLPYWTDENIEPGTESWHMFIENAIENAGCMVVLMSPDSKNSIWVRRELEYATSQHLPILPLLIRGDESNAVPFALMGSQHVDIRKDLDKKLDRVLSAVRQRFEETHDKRERQSRQNQ